MFCHGDKGQRDIYYQIVLYSFPVTNYYSNTKGPQLGQKTFYFAKWWGNPKGLLGQMPHYSTVLKNALGECQIVYNSVIMLCQIRPSETS